MKSQLTRTALGFAGMMILATVPAFSSVIFQFNGGSGAVNDGATNISNGSNLASSTFISFNSFSETINGSTTYFPSSGGNVPNLFEMVFASSPGSLTFSNDANSASTPVGQNLTGGTAGPTHNLSLYSALTGLTFINNSNGGILSESFGGTGTLSSLFLSEFTNLPAGAGTNFVISGGISGTYSGTTGNVTSDTITFTLTPEPRSVFLLGAGLLAIVVIARKRLLPAGV